MLGTWPGVVTSRAPRGGANVRLSKYLMISSGGASGFKRADTDPVRSPRGCESEGEPGRRAPTLVWLLAFETTPHMETDSNLIRALSAMERPGGDRWHDLPVRQLQASLAQQGITGVGERTLK